MVPTLNRGSYLIDTLHDLLAQEYRPIEILVVDQSGEKAPALLDLVLKHPDLISYHKVQFRGLPLARNYGWQHAKYEAIVFVDDDIRCGPSLVSEHLRGLTRTNIGMVAGGIDENAFLPRKHERTWAIQFLDRDPSTQLWSKGRVLRSACGGLQFFSLALGATSSRRI